MPGSKRNRPAQSSFWVHVRRDAYSPAWKGLASHDAAARWSGVSLSADIHHCVLLAEALIRVLLYWPYRFFFAAPKEILARRFAVIGPRLREHIYSAEFWLGLSCGMIVRVTTRYAIAAAFAPAHGKEAALAGFAACAGAGLAAGMAVHLVRVLYRNSKRSGAEKEKYWNKAFVESAATGLLGGFLGGFVLHAGMAVARAGSLAIGMTVGAAAGVLHAGIKDFRNTRGKRARGRWGRRVFTGAAFGAVGGVLGIAAADLLGAHDSVAAPLGNAGPTIDVQPPVAVIPPPPGPIQLVTVGPEGAVPHLQMPPVATENLHVSTAHNACPRPTHRVVHHVAHRPVRRMQVKHTPPARLRPPFEEIVIIDVPPPSVVAMPPPLAVVPIVGPPPVMQTISQPIHYDPCVTGYPVETPYPYQGPPHAAMAPQAPQSFAPSYNSNQSYNSSQLDLHGPCADPATACVERVSFNQDGDATKVVLEPRAASRPGWNNAAQGVTVASSSDSDESQVSLVMPFVDRSAAPGLA